MCRRVQCTTCGKPTFAGCGAHVEQVLRDVPTADRCRCREAGTTRAPATAAPPSDASSSKGWLRGLLGK